MDRRIEEINIVKYILLSVATFGLFYLYWQYRQIQICSLLMGSQRDSFIKWLFLSIITFGIYHLYHEYKTSQDIIEIQRKYNLKEKSSNYPILCLLVSIFGMFFLSDMIHQDDLNKIISELNLKGYFFSSHSIQKVG